MQVLLFKQNLICLFTVMCDFVIIVTAWTSNSLRWWWNWLSGHCEQYSPTMLVGPLRSLSTSWVSQFFQRGESYLALYWCESIKCLSQWSINAFLSFTLFIAVGFRLFKVLTVKKLQGYISTAQNKKYSMLIFVLLWTSQGSIFHMLCIVS